MRLPGFGDHARWTSSPVPEGGNSHYWDQVATRYDLLYQDTWSLLEDSEISHLLPPAPARRPVRVLDLACGTGLGFELSSKAYGEVTYTGRDSSSEMLQILQKKYPEVVVNQGAMEDLHDLPHDAFDVVTVLSTSGSYARSLSALAKQIIAALVPGGWAHVSVLNRTALRRLLRGNLMPHELYRTRGDKNITHGGVWARTYLKGEVRKTVESAGFSAVSIDTIGTLSGVLEQSVMWPLSRSFDMKFPFLGHTYEVVARK